jgi:hypothetical protein
MEGLIFENIIQKITDSSKNINKYFNNYDLYNSNIYDIILKLPKYNIIIYILIIFLIYNFISRLNIRLNDILVFIVCLLVIYLLIKKDYTEFIYYTIDKKKQLDFLHKLMFDEYTWDYEKESNLLVRPITGSNKSYLYLNPALIDFFYNIREYSQYNISSYINALIHSNNVIGFEYQAKIGLNNSYENYDTATLEVKKALNQLNSVIYNLPSSLIGYNKFKDSINILHGLLNQHLIEMSIIFKNNNKEKDINISQMPDNFFERNFYISSNDTKTRDFNPIFDVY